MNQVLVDTRRRNRMVAHMKTFEDRGIRIKFTHKHLQSLRLRVPKGPDPRDWEVTLQNYFGTGAENFAVLQYIHLPSFVQMERRDMELYEAILSTGKQRPVDPFTVRTIHLQIESEFAEDSETREVAKREIETEEIERKGVHLSFLAHLVRECTMKMGDMSLKNANNDAIKQALLDSDGSIVSYDQNELMQKVAKFMAAKYKIGTTELTERVENLARLLSPFGSINVSVEGRTDGFLSREFARLKEFHKQMLAVESNGTQSLRDTAAVILFGTKEYVDLISNRLDTAEQKLSNFAVLLSQYDDSIRAFKKTRRDVVFALDGWGVLIDTWDAANQEPEGEARDAAVREALAYILQWLPILPNEEIAGEERKAIWQKYDAIRTNVVRLMHSWFDDEPDWDMIDRVKQAKQKEDSKKPGKDWSELDGEAY